MYEDFHFLRAILQQPDDDTLRLIYADWLEERGDRRAEYVRLEVELHRVAKGDKKRGSALQKQLLELAPQLDAAWCARMWLTRSVPRGLVWILFSWAKARA